MFIKFDSLLITFDIECRSKAYTSYKHYTSSCSYFDFALRQILLCRGAYTGGSERSMAERCKVDVEGMRF